jgi:KipI family sensor histidine kinase inhibitor
MPLEPKGYKLVPLGDRAILADFSPTLDLDVNAEIQRLAQAIRRARPKWLQDVVPALGSLALHFDRASLDKGASPLRLAGELIERCLAGKLPELGEFARTIELPVCYEGDLAPDLEDVARRCGLTPEEVVRRHASSPHRVLMVGFVPGHPYIGGLDPQVSVPRRATPRQRVAIGSVATANAQTVVYPFDSPSGWSVIGRTPERIFDVHQSPPALMGPGDRVKFVPITRKEFERLSATVA